jgi:hypothetical protein
MDNTQLAERRQELQQERSDLAGELEESKKLRLLQKRQQELANELSQIDSDLKLEQHQKSLLERQTMKTESAKRLIGGLYSSGSKPDFEATGLTFTPGADSNEMEAKRPKATFTDEFNSQHFHGRTFKMFYKNQRPK